MQNARSFFCMILSQTLRHCKHKAPANFSQHDFVANSVSLREQHARQFFLDFFVGSSITISTKRPTISARFRSKLCVTVSTKPLPIFLSTISWPTVCHYKHNTPAMFQYDFLGNSLFLLARNARQICRGRFRS